MKIGILTFHNVPNYGAVLQAYALKTTIKAITGETVQIVHHQCAGNDDSFLARNFEKRYSNSNSKIKSLLKRIVYSLFIKADYIKKSEKFENFRNVFLELNRECCSAEGLDCVICGSDQIWNPNITQGFDKEYFGSSVPSARKISYAASCGDVSSVEKNEAEFITLVNGLDFVGVREKSLFEYLAERGIQARQTIDPTFLLSKEDYIEAFNLEPSLNDEPYLLVYALQFDKDLYKQAKLIAQEKGYRIKYICGFVKKSIFVEGDFSCGPIDFLNLLYGAKHILTNSFHGVAFSVIFRKTFNVVLPNSRTSRVVDFLSIIGLDNRLIVKQKCSDYSDIDYEQIEPVLNLNIEKSKEFLRRALGIKE